MVTGMVLRSGEVVNANSTIWIVCELQNYVSSRKSDMYLICLDYLNNPWRLCRERHPCKGIQRHHQQALEDDPNSLEHLKLGEIVKIHITVSDSLNSVFLKMLFD